MKLTTHVYLVPRWSKTGATSLFPLQLHEVHRDIFTFSHFIQRQRLSHVLANSKFCNFQCHIHLFNHESIFRPHVLRHVLSGRMRFVHKTSCCGSERLGQSVGQCAYCLLYQLHFSHINAHSLRLSGPCHGSGSKPLVTQSGGPGSVTGQFIWD